jgi:ankyrin repeat protein
MSGFKYEKELGPGEFRLLRLFKGDQDPIQCELFESKLAPSEQTQDYAALSYTWGSESTPCDIIMNGMKREVTTNVYLALRDLRFQEKERFLWIDGLSINQSDKKEKSYQVQQMGSIYSNAERVVIWLGQATYETDYFMYHAQQLERESMKYASDNQEISDSQWTDIWVLVVQNLRDNQRDFLVKGLQLLLRRDWFKRVWILQETANARIAEIVCGRKSVSASIFARTPSLLKIDPEDHCKSVLEIMPGPLRYSSWWAEKRDLYTLLDKFRGSDATKPHDKIYALLGISSDADNPSFPKANYEESIQDVVFNTSLFLLKLNDLNSPVCRFFDWTLPEFLRKLNVLATEVLLHAANTGHEAIVKLLLKTKADIELKDSTNRTLLSQAAENGHEAVVKLLLNAKANIESKDRSNWTPLSRAAKNGQEAIVKLLLEAKANIDSKDSYKRTPLSQAAENGQEAVVKLLLEAKADIELKDSYNWTPLSRAAANGQEAVVKLLLEAKADIESKGTYNQTPLSRAAGNGHEAVVKLLLKAKADIKSKDEYNETPLSRAAGNGHEAVVKLLLEAKADIESKDSFGLTPLLRAAENEHEAVVKLLLEAKANIKSKDEYNQTPLLRAAGNGHEAIVKLL